MDEQILKIICDPDDKNDLDFSFGKFINKKTKKEYEIRQEIPLLYSKKTDLEHIAKETELACMMQRIPKTKKDKFSFEQWKKAKQEFWNIIKDYLKNKSDLIAVNIGSGFDDHSKEFEKQGSTLINFDLIHAMLLKSKNQNQGQNYIAGDINSLPFKLNSFDMIICTDVIHHEYNNIENLLNSFKQILKPDGMLFLEDPNAWGLFQIPKTVFLPKPLYRLLRNIFHKLKKSDHKPADYEFPTSFCKTKKILKKLGFKNIKFYPHNSYPETGRFLYSIYKITSFLPFVKKYHNYHYTLSANK